MPEYTDNYGLSKLRAGEQFSADSYKFTRQDRDTIDRLLFLGAQGHRHTGGSTDLPVVDLAPLLEVDPDGGSMSAGTRYFYCYSLIDPFGFETAASPESFTDTPPEIAAPAAPVLSVSPTGGTLPPGNYYYALSAYTEFDSNETRAFNAAFVSVPYSNGTTSVITLTLPTLPGGADGFNVYRRTPSGSGYYHVGSIDMASEPTTWVDNGTRIEDCDRFAPEVSTALSRNGILVSMPTDTDLPAGYSWRVYRSTRSGDFSNSLLATIADGGRSFLDQGNSTQAGQPPTQGIAPGAPAQIQLTDGAEVQGRLPVSAVSAWPHEVTFSFPGSLTPSQGVMTWVCPFPQARLLAVRGVLGRGQTATGDVTFSPVVQQDGGDGNWVAVLIADARILSGDSDNVANDFVIEQLQVGDKLAVDITGSDAANMHLNVVVSMYLYGFADAASESWEALRD